MHRRWKEEVTQAMTQRLRGSLGLLLLVALLLPGVSSASSPASHSQEFRKMQSSMASLGQKSGKEFEIAYINSIIPHHQAAIQMAKLVVDDAPHPQVREAARKIIDSQQKEINDLTGWLKQWYGQQPNPDPTMKMSQAMMSQMMQATPAMREKLFLAMMREHHQSAIDMGQMALDNATHQQLKDQAQEMITAQKKEQKEFGTWLQKWYGITPPTPTGDMQDGMDAVMGMPSAGAGGMAGTESGRPWALPLVGVAATGLALLVMRRKLLNR